MGELIDLDAYRRTKKKQKPRKHGLGLAWPGSIGRALNSAPVGGTVNIQMSGISGPHPPRLTPNEPPATG